MMRLAPTISLRMIRPVQRSCACQAAAHAARYLHSGTSSSYNDKYAAKLRQKAQEKGLNLEDLKAQAREEIRLKQKKEASSFLASLKRPNSKTFHLKTGSAPSEGAAGTSSARKDSSPIKLLSSILNLSKLLATPHTPSQVSALWTAYHASRTKGTGRGYICATLPVESYNTMTHVAKKYPVFVIPVPRESTSNSPSGENTGTAHEFFFLQWDFHPPPPPLDLFEPVTPGSSCHIPESSTVLFTPLQEYKLRNSFATPYLVLTFYTDMSQSHGIVLLRGEITPSSTSAAVLSGQELGGRFLLSQVDAQLLAMGVQRYYLWEDGKNNGDNHRTAEAQLKQFHEEPEKFSWQNLLESSNVIS